jgi:phosphatidylserine/phosphatidylglycerophosphate/cardiolipin synthase-like enzyme
MVAHAWQNAVSLVDRTLGDGLERQVAAHHRRRLRGLGWEHAFSPGPGLWAEADPPSRPGNALELLVDGEVALPRIAEALTAARSQVSIAGWEITPDFALTRSGSRLVLRDVLAELAERMPVRVLLWAGAPLPVFRPWRLNVRAVRRRLTAGTRIQVALDSHERPLHTHHEKLIVVDDEVAFVGGIDLTDDPVDRFDGSDHAYRRVYGWHDVACELRGPAVGDVAAHIALRWREVTGEALAVTWPEGAGDVQAQIVSTIPERRYAGAWDGRFRILEAYLRAIRAARRFIYLENQFLWAPEIVAALRDKLLHPPSPEFRLVVLLPSKAYSGQDDTQGQLGVLADADEHGKHFLACTIYARSAGVTSAPVYVHAKVGIVDDQWLTVGSANLNDHSLFNDTEVNLVTCDAALARAARIQLWSEHLEASPDELQGDPVELIDSRWKPIAYEQQARRDGGGGGVPGQKAASPASLTSPSGCGACSALWTAWCSTAETANGAEHPREVN